MSKKTEAYSDGYTAGLANSGMAHNPYDEQEQNEQFNDWKHGYGDGFADRDTDSSEDEVLEDEDEYEDEDGEYDEDDEDVD